MHSPEKGVVAARRQVRGRGYTGLVLRILLVALAVGSVACSRPVQRARTTMHEPYSQAEVDSYQRIKNRRCSESWAYLPVVLGVGQFCLRKNDEALGLATVGAIEMGTAVALASESELGPEHPGVGISLAAFQDSYIIGVADMLIERDRARAHLYAPTDSIEDLLAAPFNIEVMKDPKVWAGLAGVLAIGVGASLALSGDGGLEDTDPFGDVNLFGKQVSPILGYPAGLATFGGLFAHVAPAEEMLFRGVVQSEAARAWGENTGWLVGSLIFGLAHAPNALALPDEERSDYLRYGLPVITVAGSYLGYLYKDSDYSLAAPTAVHFWYDFLLSSVFFAIDPQNSPLSANLSLRF